MKKNVLAYSDFFLTGTGFGVVSKYVLRALSRSGLFEIDQLAINYNGEFFDREQHPYQVTPAKLLDPKDPYGARMFLNAIETGKYDYVWVMNDTFVVEVVARQLPTLFAEMKMKNLKIPKIVYYCPIDLKVLPQATSMLRIADHVVAYCQFGKEEILKALPEIENKLSVITHGTDSTAFTRLSDPERKELRKKLLHVDSDETFVWMNVARNSPRKDLPRTILAFKEFRKLVPDSKLYLHTAPRDTTIDLLQCVEDLGFSIKDDVIFPANYAAHKPFPIEVLNMFYNCADGFINTTLGEGWGIVCPDAMLIDLPLVTPNNTVYPEQTDNGKRAWLYECKDKVWIDNSGYRPVGRIEDIVDQMHQCYQDIKTGKHLEKTEPARTWAKSISWERIGEQWVKLFKSLDTKTKVDFKRELKGKML